MFCFSRSQSASVAESILVDEDDYYFGSDFSFAGVICYCTSDFCNFPGRGVASRPTGEVVVLVICCAVASVVKKIGIFR